MARQDFLLGLDIGTQGVKGGLFSHEGHLIAEAGEPSNLLHPEAGATTEDPEYQYQSVIRIIASCLRQAKEKGYERIGSQVAALAIDGQMAGVLGVGADGMAVTPYDSWLDSRCAKYLEFMRKEAEDEILAKSGTAPSINHGPKKLWWMHEHPEVFETIEKFIQPGGYVAGRLCGLKGSEFFIDRTYLHFSGFADTANGRWDEDLCRRFSFPMAKLPRIVEPTEVVGTITEEIGKQCGLAAGTKVVAGCGDTVASFLSSGAVEEGMCVDVAGTASVFAITHKYFLPDHRSKTLGCCASVDPELWYSYAYVNGGGMNPEWFVNQFTDAEGPARFKDLEDQVSRLPDTPDLPLFVPHFAGRVMPPRPFLRGAWANLNWNHTKIHLFRAVLESIALEYGIYLEAAQALQEGLRPKEIRITGGGEKSRLWNEMKSGVLSAPVVRIKRNIGAPMGAAMVAAVGAELFKDIQEVSAAWIESGERIECDPGRQEFFKQRLASYKKLLAAMERFSEEEGTR